MDLFASLLVLHNLLEENLEGLVPDHTLEVDEMPISSLVSIFTNLQVLSINIDHLRAPIRAININLLLAESL
jgi:hypothetical protein